MTGDAVALYRYEIVREVQTGERTRVYKARDLVTDTFVAVKKLLPGATDTTKEQFINDYRIMSGCRHPILVPVIDFGTFVDDGALFQVMPWIQSIPIHEHDWNSQDLKRLTLQILQTLVYLHRANLAFENLNLSNVLWLQEPDASGYSIRLINYGTPRYGDPQRDSLLRDTAAKHRLDLQRLLMVVEALSAECGGEDASSYRLGREEMRALKTRLREAIHSSQPMESDITWSLTLRLISEFENRPYAQRPSRQVEFTEAPFLGRQNTLMELNSWLRQSGPGAVLLFGSLAWMGRYRILRHWLPEIRINGRVVIELDRHTDLSSCGWLQGKSLPENHSQLMDWLDSLPTVLVVIHREALADNFAEYMAKIFPEIRRRGWQIIISVNDQYMEIFEKNELIPAGNTHRMWLPPISYSDTCRTLAALLDSTNLSRRLQQAVHKIARGNPGLIVKTINFWIKEDLLIKENDQWRLMPDQNIPLPIPAEIQNHFRKRLQMLSPDAREILNTMALVDAPLDMDELKMLLPVESLKEIIDMLVDRDLVSMEKKTTSGYGYRFSHNVIKMALLETMPEEDTRKAHLAIAKNMEKYQWPIEKKAWHWFQSGQHEKGVRNGLEAAWMYRRQGHFTEAEEWVDRLRRNLDGLPSDLKGCVYYLHAEISLLRHHNQDVLDSSRKALGLLPTSGAFIEERSFLHQYIAQVYMRQGEYTEASNAVRAGLSELAGDNFETTVTLRILSGVICRHMGAYEEAVREMDAARREMDKIPDAKSRASAEATILNLQSTIEIDKGELIKARSTLDTAVRISDENTFVFYRALLRNKYASLESSLGNYSVAETHLAEAMRICDTMGIPSEKATALLINGNIAVHRGQFVDAETYYKRALAITETLNRTTQSRRIKRLQARLYRLTGRFSEARKNLQELFETMNTTLATPANMTLNIEAGMLELSSASYTSALRYLYKALDLARKMKGHRHEAWAYYGLANAFWRLNHLNRTEKSLSAARKKAEAYGNRILVAWVSLLESRLARLDRNRRSFRNKIDEARAMFDVLENESGRLAVWELDLRDKIDKDLSQSIWNEAVKLWEEVRRTGSWQHVVSTAITLSRLGVRRGNFIQIAGILDAAIGMARDRGCREELWRLLRVRAQSLQEQGFIASARESLLAGTAVIDNICREIRSPVLKRAYRLRYDVKNMQQRLQTIDRLDTASSTSFQALPSLSSDTGGDGTRTFVFTSEHNRLLRQAVRRFRHHLEPDDLLDDLLDVLLKLTGVDRAIVFLRQSGEDTYHIGKHRRVGTAPEIDGKIIRSSALFEKVITEKSNLFSHNLHTDRRFSGTMIGRYIGARSVLLSPMRAARDIKGILYLDIRSGSEEMLEVNAPLVQELADEAALSLEISSLYKDLDDTFMSMVRALGTTVDAKDEYTHGHAARVAEYALMIGNELGLSSEELRDLEIGAYLHDIGKIGIAGGILKSRDKLSASEMETIRHHPEIGTRILSPIRKLSRVAIAIRQHHERFDGTGYPDQLKGEEILLIARIIAVADALDAMTTVRPYQTPMSIQEAVDVITRNAGTQFDPQIARVVNRLYKRGRFDFI